MSGSPDLILAAVHWIEYLGLLGAIGTIVVRRLARHPPVIAWARQPPLYLALGVAFVGGLAVVTVEGFDAGALPGWERLARVGAEGLAFVFCVRRFGFPVPLALLAAALLSVAGHATAYQQPGAVFVDVVHVLSAGMWAGGILALATLHPPAGWRAPEGGALLDRFGGVALIAFAVTALTGVLRASDQLHDISGLWTTTYGEVLGLKSIGVVIMLVLSAVAWRRGVPLARAEALVALLVVGATAVLAAFPTPH
ncbi:MAG: CopD family protein [Candidatus Dormibacteraceae bacterium]